MFAGPGVAAVHHDHRRPALPERRAGLDDRLSAVRIARQRYSTAGSCASIDVPVRLLPRRQFQSAAERGQVFIRR